MTRDNLYTILFNHLVDYFSDSYIEETIDKIRFILRDPIPKRIHYFKTKPYLIYEMNNGSCGVHSIENNNETSHDNLQMALKSIK